MKARPLLLIPSFTMMTLRSYTYSHDDSEVSHIYTSRGRTYTPMNESCHPYEGEATPLDTLFHDDDSQVPHICPPRGHTYTPVNESHGTHKRARKLLATLPHTFIHDGKFVMFRCACRG